MNEENEKQLRKTESGPNWALIILASIIFGQSLGKILTRLGYIQ